MTRMSVRLENNEYICQEGRKRERKRESEREKDVFLLYWRGGLVSSCDILTARFG